MSVRYAVVDLEATSTNLKEGRLIQFSCAFIKNHKIESVFNTYINPGIPLDDEIKRLTGISDEKLKEAPYFEDVADYLFHLLEDCVFVAHNVLFDYRFLQKQFKRVGLSSFHLPAIDTVELSQILLPTLPQYRLSEMTKQLNIPHERPHQADSDARATAELFLYLEKVACQLPLPLLKQLLRYQSLLVKDTGTFLQQCYQKVKASKTPLPKHLTVISGLVLQRQPSYPTLKYVNANSNVTAVSWQEAVKQPRSCLQGTWTTERYVQLCLAYRPLIQKTQPLILSCPSEAMQKWLMSDILPQVQAISQQPLHCLQVQPCWHYIDLESFYQSWKEEEQPRVVRLLQMRLLVWLSQTTTGNLDELNITVKQHPYWKTIEHKGIDYLSKRSAFYRFDFLRRQKEWQQNSEVFILTHDQLVKASQLPANSHLVILEHEFFMKLWRRHHIVQLPLRDLTQFKWGEDTLLLANKDKPAWDEQQMAIQQEVDQLRASARLFFKEQQEALTTTAIKSYQPIANDDKRQALVQAIIKMRQRIQKVIPLVQCAHNKKNHCHYWIDQLTQCAQRLTQWEQLLSSNLDESARYFVYQNRDWWLCKIPHQAPVLSQMPWYKALTSLCFTQSMSHWDYDLTQYRLADTIPVTVISEMPKLTLKQCDTIDAAIAHLNTSQQHCMAVNLPEKIRNQCLDTTVLSQEKSLIKQWRYWLNQSPHPLLVTAEEASQLMMTEASYQLWISPPLLTPKRIDYWLLKQWVPTAEWEKVRRHEELRDVLQWLLSMAQQHNEVVLLTATKQGQKLCQDLQQQLSSLRVIKIS